MKRFLRIISLYLACMMLFTSCVSNPATTEGGETSMTSTPTPIPTVTTTPATTDTASTGGAVSDIPDTTPIIYEQVPFETVDKHKTETVAGGYEIDMGDLVQVYFAEHPEWVELYNKSWQLHKSKIQRIPEATNPERPYYVDEAFSGNIFVWDTIFMMLYDRYGMNQFPILSSLENFYYCQLDSKGIGNGYIPREIIEESGKDFWNGFTDPTSTNPPLFSWAEWSCYMIHGDVSRFSKEIKGKTIYQRLCDHYSFIEKNKKSKFGLYGKTNGLGTGLDDSPNQGSGQLYNSLSIQQAQNAYYLSLIANAMGNTKDAEYYASEHKRISALINDLMWNEENSMYSNLTGQGQQTNISTPTSLWALVGRVATEERADKMIKNQALNAEKLFRPGGLSTLAYDHPEYVAEGGYWCGAIWAPTSYQYVKGLEAYGYDTVAFEESVRLVNTLSDVYQAGKKGGYVKKATLYENYSAEYVRQGFKRIDWELTRSDFAGWTPCMSIGLMIENVAGVSINAPENTVNWNVSLIEHYSVSNLYFVHDGVENRVSLAAAQRNSASDPLIFSVKCDKPFTLKVTACGVTKEYEISEGISTFCHGSEKAADKKVSSLSIKATPVDKAGMDEIKNCIDTAEDFVYFKKGTGTKLSQYTAGKKSGELYNFSTVGRPAPSVGCSNAENLDDAGYADAAALSRYYYAAGNEGFMFCSRAVSDQRVLRVLVSVGKGSGGVLSAALSDASEKSVSIALTEGSYIVEIPYSSASDDRYLLVKWTLDNSVAKTEATENKDLTVSLEAVVLN